MTTLHFIMDPQCGWCYAVAPLIDALTELPCVDIKTHGGGLFSGTNKRPLSTGFYQQIIAMDNKITMLTGQIFSQSYYSNILENKKRIVDSDTPITALLAAESLGINTVTMLHKMQTAQFVDGFSQSNTTNLCNIANEFGANNIAFLTAFNHFKGERTQRHISNARQMLNVVGGNGFPTLAFEHSDGTFTKLDHNSYYGQPTKWLAYVKQSITTID